MSESSIGVRQLGETAWVKVVGRATFTFGHQLREFVVTARERGVKRVAVDLAECLYMDSTFIGVLAMVAVQTVDMGIRLQIVNAGPVPRAHLASLGVAGFFSYAESPALAGPWEPLEKRLSGAACTRLQSQGRTVLAAHEALGAANPENVARFRDVVACLRQEVQAAEPPAPERAGTSGQ